MDTVSPGRLKNAQYLITAVIGRLFLLEA